MRQIATWIVNVLHFSGRAKSQDTVFLSPWRLGFDLRLVFVGFAVGKAALGQAFLGVLLFPSPVSYSLRSVLIILVRMSVEMQSCPPAASLKVTRLSLRYVISCTTLCTMSCTWPSIGAQTPIRLLSRQMLHVWFGWWSTSIPGPECGAICL